MTFLGRFFGRQRDSTKTTPSAEASALIARLGIEDDAINNLADLGDRGAVPALLVLLEKGDKRARYAATVVLGRLGDRRAVMPLIRQLVDREPYLRRNAAWALGAIGDKKAVQPLIFLLCDPHEDVRHDVAEALGKFRDTRAVEPLRGLLRDKDWVRQAAAVAIEKITGKAAR